MGQSFSRSLRSLETDRFRPSLILMISALCLAGLWATWATLARVNVWEVSRSARVETAKAVHWIEAPVAGRVVQTAMDVGQRVTSGALLVVLETGPESRQLDQARALQRGLRQRLSARLTERESVLAANRETLRGSEAALAAARAQQTAANAARRLTEQQLQRASDLMAHGLLSVDEFDQLQAQREEATAEHAATVDRVQQLEADAATLHNEGEARLAAIDSEIADLRAQIEHAVSELERLDLITAEHQIRASTDGLLGHVETIRPGSFVDEGDLIAALVPAGQLRIVGQFPADGIGRIRSGQSARLRLDAFPWLQHGELAATVLSVGNEPVDGTVHVLLELAEPPRLPLEHGLTGSVAVLIERSSPLELLLRAVGTRHGKGRPVSA